jgi:DNA-binding MarR family transcriptional regulator
MAEQLPLPALLSQALVAFTIEFDNEFEHRMPHTTTDHGATGPHGGPWLVSMAMWFNCMQFIGEEPMPVAELLRRARTGTNLDGMRRWGYVFLESASGDAKRRPPPRDLTIRATRKGHRAQEVWRPLPAVIEDRWRERFGAAGIGRLRASLWALAAQAEAEVPDCLPILGPGLFSGRKQTYPRRTPEAGPDPGPAGLPLPVLMARVLLGYAIHFERRSPLSLAICANVLRILDSPGVRVRDLPARSGVSKESIAMAMGILTKRDLVTVGTDPAGGRGKVARLTPPGQTGQWDYTDGIAALEQKSAERFGADAIARLRAALEALAGDPDDPAASPLMQGLEPYPDNWRADVRPPRTLPHYPMVLHRGGFPDGS